MPEKKSEFYDKFSKDIYSTIKTLGHEDKGDFIIDTYESLYGKLKDSSDSEELTSKQQEQQNQTVQQTRENTTQSAPATGIDLDKIRSEIGQIRGIGKQKLAEIMRVIERNLR